MLRTVRGGHGHAALWKVLAIGLLCISIPFADTNMKNPLGTFIKKAFLGKNQNLFSLEDPFDVMQRLLKGIPARNILDAGASRGRVSQKLLTRFPQATVHAFEPNPLYRDILDGLARSQPRFRPFYMALSHASGEAELNVTLAPGSTSLLTPTARPGQANYAGAQIKEKITVPVVTIDDWSRQNGIPGIELMKFDIQGYELHALKGAVETLKSSTAVIYSEVWFNPAYQGSALLSDIDLFLRDHQFVLYDIYKPSYKRTGVLHWANAIFIHEQRVCA